MQDKKKIIIFIVFSFILAAFIFGIIYYQKIKNNRQNNQNNAPEEENLIPKHNCHTNQFSQKVKRGDKISFDVFLEPSEPGKNYRLKPSGFPPGVAGKFTENSSGKELQARIDLEITDQAPNGSYTMAILYEEETGKSGEYILNMCKYNLIIE